MVESVEKVVESYLIPSPVSGPRGDNVSTSVRYPEEVKIMIETMAHHFGAKKSSLLNELVIAAVYQAWEKAEESMPPELLQEHAEDIERMVNEGLLKGEE